VGTVGQTNLTEQKSVSFSLRFDTHHGFDRDARLPLGRMVVEKFEGNNSTGRIFHQDHFFGGFLANAFRRRLVEPNG
jgi:hypothetical protein